MPGLSAQQPLQRLAWQGQDLPMQPLPYAGDLTAGIISHAGKLSLVKCFQAMYFLTQTKKNVSALELKRLIGVCYRTARRVKSRMLQVMSEREERTVFSRRVPS